MVSIPRKEGVFNSQEVYLYDSLLNSIHNVSNVAYSFSTNAMLIENRFYLIFSDYLPNLAQRNTENQVTIYSKNGVVVVKSNQSNIKNVAITDIYTIKNKVINVDSTNKSNNQLVEIPVDEASKLLNVKVTLDDGTVVHKKIFR